MKFKIVALILGLAILFLSQQVEAKVLDLRISENSFELVQSSTANFDVFYDHSLAEDISLAKNKFETQIVILRRLVKELM